MRTAPSLYTNSSTGRESVQYRERKTVHMRESGFRVRSRVLLYSWTNTRVRSFVGSLSVQINRCTQDRRPSCTQRCKRRHSLTRTRRDTCGSKPQAFQYKQGNWVQHCLHVSIESATGDFVRDQINVSSSTIKCLPMDTRGATKRRGHRNQMEGGKGKRRRSNGEHCIQAGSQGGEVN
jgi:hypothetical protein